MSDESVNADGGKSKTTYVVPGGPTLTDKRTPPDVDHYTCPYCEYGAETERLVRVHITQEDDGKHANRNGFLDAIFVHAVDEDGEIVEAMESPKKATFAGTESTSFLPKNVEPDTKQGEILLTAIKNPSLTPMQIAERIYDNPKQGCGYVYKTLNTHLSTPEVQKRKDAERKKTWNDLRDKQKAVIRAHLANPDIDNMSELARRADVSPNYPKMVLEEYDYIVQSKKSDSTEAVDEPETEADVDDVEADVEADVETGDAETLRDVFKTDTTVESNLDAGARDGQMYLTQLFDESGECVSEVSWSEEEYRELFTAVIRGSDNDELVEKVLDSALV